MASSAAWDITTGSPSLIALVVDTGIDYNHPDLLGNIWRNPAEVPNNGVDDDRNGYIDDISGINTITGSGNPMDDNGHGTHVAGIIGAVGNNTTGVVGVNWTVKLVGAKFLSATGSGSSADAIKAITYGTALRAAGHRVVAMNNSWGGTTYSKPLLDAITAASDAGILFVAAAGNNARNNDTNPFYPAGYKAPNVISVASTDSSGALSSFSNFGSQSVHIAAPGSSIYSTVLRNGYGYKSGTSMAAPQVAGLALLTQSACDQLTLAGLKTTLLANGLRSSYLIGRVSTSSMANAAGAVLSARATCGSLTLPTPSPTPNPIHTSTPTPTASPTPTITPTITPTATATPGHYLIATPSRVQPRTTVTFQASTGADYANYGRIEIRLHGPDGRSYPCDYTGYIPLTKGTGSVKVTIPDTAKFFSSMQFTFTSKRGVSITVLESLTTTPTYVPYSRALLTCKALAQQFR
jgi:subtilisin family serine protease